MSRSGGDYFDTGVQQGQLRVDHADSARITYGASAPSVTKVTESWTRRGPDASGPAVAPRGRGPREPRRGGGDQAAAV